MDEFIEKLSLLLEEKVEDLNLNANSVLRDIPGWSSLKVISLIMMINLEYDVLVTNSDVNECITIEDLYRLISDELV